MRQFAVISLVSLLVPGTLAEGAPECFCTGSRGERFELGDIVCLSVGGRSYSAQCQMSLNVPMWREVASTCVIS